MPLSKDVALIAGAVVGGVVVMAALSIIVMLTLAWVYAARRYRTVLRNGGARTTTSRDDNLAVEMKVNKSYVPVDHNISTEQNVAYGQHSFDNSMDEMTKNAAYLSTTHHTSTHGENEGEYDYII